MIDLDKREDGQRDLATVTSDFIFGTLTMDALRIEVMQRRSRGLWHGSRITPQAVRPGDDVTLTVSVGQDLSVVDVRTYYSLDGSDPGMDQPSVPFQCVGTEWDTLSWSYLEQWEAILPAQPDRTLVAYRMSAATNDGETVWAESEGESEPALFAYHVDDHGVAEWVREAVIYQVFVDRFSPGRGRDWLRPDRLDGIWGGTLRGVIERLPYLQDLGVTCLWLTPVFPSPTHHGYDATDYGRVEPRLGTDDDLAELIEQAHALGIRILLGFVANHVSHQHPAFVAAQDDADSLTRDWFTFYEDGYESFFGVDTMPELVLDRPGARDYLLEHARRWLRAGLDGFRLDYAQGPSMSFWAWFRQATLEEQRDAFTVGEIVESAETMRSYGGLLDGTLDFLFLQQVRAFLAFDLLTPAAFHRFLTRHLRWFGDAIVLPTFLDNHDMNRFLWNVGGDTRRLKLAALLQFTLPGPPIIYYGTEVGLSQWHDLEYPDGSRRMEESRTPMLWDEEQDADLLAFYTALIRDRRLHPGVWNAERTAITMSEDGRYVERVGSRLVALNRSEHERTCAVPDGPWTIAAATEPGVRVARATLHLPAMSGAILEDGGLQ